MAVISLVLNPIWSLLYLNRGRFAARYFIFLCIAMLFPFIAAHRNWLAGDPVEIATILGWGILTVCFIHGIFIASYWKDERPFRWYAHGGNTVYLVLAIGGIYMLVRHLAYEPLYIPYTSMSPTFSRGDYVLMNKIIGTLKQGDVIAVRQDARNMTHVLRITAMPAHADGYYLLGGDNNVARVQVKREHIRGTVPYILWSKKHRKMLIDVR